jgi:hypothetical protein
MNYISQDGMLNTNTPPLNTAELQHVLIILTGFSHFSTPVRVVQQTRSARFNHDSMASMANMRLPLQLTKLINGKNTTLPTV